MFDVGVSCSCCLLVQLMVKMAGFSLSGDVTPSVYAANRADTQPGFSDSRGTDIMYICSGGRGRD